jgi:hypothetical protein
MDTQVPTVAAVSPIFKAARNSDRSANEHWWIASYSSLKTRGIQNSGLPANADSSRTPDIARDDQVMEESAAVAADNAVSQPSFSRQNPGLHGFYRGPEPGTFLHGLLEWCAETGFANAATNAAQRRNEITGACELRGWQQEVDRLDDWLAGFVNTPFHLPALPQQASVILNLCELDSWQAELEFLFAAHELHTADLDRLCQIYLLPAQARPALQASQLNGMIKGFIDLVFLDKGRYYVADWKSNYLGAADAVAAVHLFGAGDHAAGVRAVVGFGQAEAADPLATRQLGQVFLLLGFRAKVVDGQHHQRRLHAHHGSVARVHALNFARHQAVADVVQARAAVLLGDGGTQKAQLAHFAEYGHIGGLVQKGIGHAGQQAILAIGAGGFLHLALVIGELRAELKGVFPAEGVFGGGHGGCLRDKILKWIVRAR